MRANIIRLFLFGTLASAACSKKESAASESTSTAAASVASAPALAESAPPREHRGGGHCPTDVSGAKTQVDDIDGGVKVTITASDDATRTEVRARAMRVSQMSEHMNASDAGPRIDRPAHGRCAVVVRGAAVSARDIDQGSELVITTKDATDVARVRAEVHDRAPK